MDPENQKQSNTLIIALLVALLIALVGLVVLIAAVAVRGSDEEVAVATSPPVVSTLPPGLVEPTPTGAPVATVIPPTPEPAVPQGTVISPSGVNVRSGPGTIYPIVFVAPFGSEGRITGRSADGEWWVIFVPGAPDNNGWVAADFVFAENAQNVPVVSAPPVPVTPTPMPAVIESFSLTPNPIRLGDSVSIQWTVGGGATSLRIIKNWVEVLVEGSELSGQITDLPKSAGAQSYRLEARNDAGQTVSQELILVVEDVNPLANTNWTLVAINVSQSPLSESTLSAFFGAEFTLSGDGGCNAFSGSYSLSGSAIVINPLAAGLASCGEAVDQQEQQYFSLLRSATSYEIIENQLILYSGGQEILRFNRS